MAQADNLRGGKIRRRDSFYGLERRPGFEDFRRWWHRVGKRRHGDIDIQDAPEARERWGEWVSEGSPTVKLGEDHG
jgi:hypothetical protein